jgi:two-component system phosphate regulon sensor histidine kinase PhoR
VNQTLEDPHKDLLSTLYELRREKNWINHLLESIVEGVITLDNYFRITYFSNGAEKITGWSRENVLKRHCDQVFKLADSNLSFSKRIPSAGEQNKLLVVLNNGREAILSFTGARLAPSEAGPARVALVFRDVSAEESTHRLLGQFLANISHEFRTPLSALAASIELLMDQAPDLSPAELNELLKSLHLGILGLQTLVDNLLESASIETGHFQVSARMCNLETIISEASNTMQPLIEKYDQGLVVELPTMIPQVKADPKRTVQVLVNLLSNASKYGPSDAEITINADVEGPYVKISVKDRGPGIPPEYRNEIFYRFMYPTPLKDNSKVGAGLGLSVVKAVIEAQGGEVGVADHPGGGSVFWFTLPLANEI